MATDSAKRPERKVTAATIAAALTTLVLWILGAYAFGGKVPDPVAGVVALIVPGLVTFAAGYGTRHTPRAVPPADATPPPPATPGPTTPGPTDVP